VIAQRVLAVLAAVFLVSSAALATLGPPDLPLDQMLQLSGGGIMRGLEEWTRQHLASWVWNDIEVPLLARPAWLIPAALGIVFAGLAVTVTPRRGAPRHRRRG
jgi:hypothetical protein